MSKTEVGHVDSKISDLPDGYRDRDPLAALMCGCTNGDITSSSGTSSGTSSTTKSTATGPDNYTFAYMGATGSIGILANANDPRLAKFEAYRRKASAPPVEYLIATIDNEGYSAVCVEM